MITKRRKRKFNTTFFKKWASYRLYRKRPPCIVNRTVPKIITISGHTVNRFPLTSDCVLIGWNFTNFLLKINMMNKTFILEMFFRQVTWSRQRSILKQNKNSNISEKLNSIVPLWRIREHPNMIENVNVVIWYSTVKPAHVVTSIKQSPVLKGHLFLVLS